MRESIGLRLVLALTVMLGAIAGAFGPGECSTSKCGRSCSMHVKPEPATVATHGCCASSKTEIPAVSTKARSSECNCEIRSAPQATLSTEAVSPSTPPMQACDLQEATAAVAIATTVEGFQIHFSGDNSPPIVSYHPDFGRAPPRV